MHIVCVCCQQLFMCIFCLFVYFVSFFGGSNLRKYYALGFFSAGYIHVQELSICWKKSSANEFIYIYKKYNIHFFRQFGRVWYIKNAFIELDTVSRIFSRKKFSFLFHNYILQPKICHIIASVNIISQLWLSRFFTIFVSPFVFRPCWIWGCPLTWRTVGPWPPSTTQSPTAPAPPVWRCCYKREPL